MTGYRSLAVALTLAAFVHAEASASPCERAIAPALEEFEKTLPLISAVIDARRVQLQLAEGSHGNIVAMRDANRARTMASPDRKLADAYLRALNRAVRQNRLLARVVRNDIDFLLQLGARMGKAAKFLREACPAPVGQTR